MTVDVDDLLENFRSALVALIPYLEAAEVSWRTGEAYDEFDSVAEALYDSLVASLIRRELEPPSVVPRYGFEPDADTHRVVWVEFEDAAAGAFVDFSTFTEAFDTVTTVRDGRRQSLPLARAHFEVREVERVGHPRRVPPSHAASGVPDRYEGPRRAD